MNRTTFQVKILKGLLCGLGFTLILLIPAMDYYLPEPNYNSLEDFSGILIEATHQENQKRWRLELENPKDSRTFYLEDAVCRSIDFVRLKNKELSAKLYRRYGLFGNFRAWELKSQDYMVVSFSQTKSIQRDMSNYFKIAIICFILTSAAFTFNEWYKEKNAKGA